MQKPFPAYDGPEPHVFVCYAHADAAEVYPELIWLREAGVNVWYDEGISPGSEFTDELGNAILGARCVLFYLSANSAASRFCRDEVYFALERAVPLIPIHLEPVELPPGLALSLSTTQGILRHELATSEHRERLLRAIEVPERPADPARQSVAPAAASRRGVVMAIVAGLALAAVAAGAILWSQRAEEVDWAREEALPEIRRMIEEDWTDYTEPYALALEVEKVIPDDQELAEIFATISLPVDVTTDPPGATVSVQRFAHPDEAWESLGTTPLLGQRMPVGIYRWRFELPGHAPVEAAHATWRLNLTGDGLLAPNTVHRQLTPAERAPAGMVRVDAHDTQYGPLPAYWIDRHEVTNRAFGEFVRGGGYERRELWADRFEDGGRVLSWEEAMARFVDRSGRPGPASWVGGTYPEGTADHPVAGVSWYEADAYARFRGRRLPTDTHWRLAQSDRSMMIGVPQLGGLGLIAPVSNFNSDGTRAVGEGGSLGTWGAYDLAGNVREWCANTTAGGRLVRGGGYADNPYRFVEGSQAPPMTRGPDFGFRTMRTDGDEPAGLLGPVEFPYLARIDAADAVDDATFEFFRRQFAYDEKALDVRIESTQRTDEWTLQRIRITAAYDDEMILNVFLPPTGEAPFQTIVYFPGSGSLLQTSSERIEDYYEVPTFLSFLIRTGRAVVYPVYQGTFERADPAAPRFPFDPAPNRYRQFFIELVKDVRRTLDYLDTREDLDPSTYTFYGMSLGSAVAAVVPAVEPRIRGMIYLAGGATPVEPPETNPVHYAPRVTVPALMIVGRHDSILSYERVLEPLFEMLGTPPEDKTLRVYETDHIPPKTAFVTDILAWLDEQFGPVGQGP